VKVIVGAPVADRAWALPHWFGCLYRQTRPPDEFVFVVNDAPDEGKTRRLLHELGPDVPQLSYGIDRTPFVPREKRASLPAEDVYRGFAYRRNQLRRLVLRREPDVFLSLDTDIMLENPRTIERLLAMLDDAPVAAPLLFLHPLGPASECFNAGFWQGGDPGSPERAWRRAVPEEAHGTIPIDIPMAAVAMRREVLYRCEYRWHECGEDMGFAQDLDQHGFDCLWDTDLECRHVMNPEAL
jgi:hypothetical protein